jgi:hypothetical protein
VISRCTTTLDAFVEALTGLLGASQRRTAMGEAALAQARADVLTRGLLRPIRFALKLQQVHAGAVAGQGLSPSVLERVRVGGRPPQAGARGAVGQRLHTRSLVAALQRA